MKRPPALDTHQAVRDITKTGMDEDTAEIFRSEIRAVRYSTAVFGLIVAIGIALSQGDAIIDAMGLTP